jgi:VanZ family protein
LDRDSKMRLLFAFYVLLIVLASLSPSSGRSFWHIDKVGHFLAYSGMVVLAFLTFGSGVERLLVLIFAIGLGAVLEWVQSFVPGRDMSFIDGIANTLGVFAGALFFRLRGQVMVEWLKSYLR